MFRSLTERFVKPPVVLEEFLTRDPFFPFVVEWHLTNACNLRCKYCRLDHSEPSDLREDYGAAVRKLVQLRPKILAITGGEPTLVRQLPAICRELKRRVNPHLCLTTNLVEGRIATQCLPYLDALIVSLDTADPQRGRSYRGVDSGLILEHLAAIRAEITRRRYPVRLQVNSVILKDTIADIPELNRQLAALDPDLGHILCPVMPATHPLSIIPDRAATAQFTRMLQNLPPAAKAKCTYELTGGEPDGGGPDRPRGFVEATRCYRRYFRVRMMSDGSCFSPCPPAAVENPVCATPCNCATDINHLLEARRKEELWALAYAGRCNRSETARLQAFVARYVRPDLPAGFYEALLDKR